MIHCNKCKYNFEPKVRTRYIEKDVEEVFFNCPKCHERYTAYYMNDKIKQMQKNKAKPILIEREMNRLEEIYSTLKQEVGR